jgi:hypothetical protein
MKLFIKKKFTSEALQILATGTKTEIFFREVQLLVITKLGLPASPSGWKKPITGIHYTRLTLAKTRSPCQGFYFNKYVVSFIKFHRVVQEENHRTRHAKLNHCIFDHRTRKPLLASRGCLSACVSSFKLPRLQLYGDHVQLHIC